MKALTDGIKVEKTLHKSSIASQPLVGLKLCRQTEVSDLKPEYNAELV